MRVFRLLTLVLLVCAWIVCVSSISSVAQETGVVRVGVTLLHSDDKAISAIDFRDRLVKALNRQKADKKRHLSVEVVALETAPGTEAGTEAKEKKCQFVLTTLLTDLYTSSVVKPNGSNTVEVPLFHATVEYQLARASDGVLVAAGSAKAEETTTLPEVVREAMAQVADKAIAEIAKTGTVPRGESPPGNNPAEGLTAGQVGVPMISQNLCAWLPTGIPHGEVLPGVCEYATTLPQKMPNFICHQEASRYRGTSRAPSDLITAAVRYEDGNETYSEIKVNGRPAAIAEAQATGLWTTGEFGSNNLRSIFDSRNQPVYEFVRESALRERAVWIFTYQIVKQIEPLWRLRVEDQVAAPPYRGELWIDQKTGAVLRFTSIAKNLPGGFFMERAELQIDYEGVAFGDGSSFLLPISFGASSSFRDGEETRNAVRFTDCHKFGAKGRLVLETASSASSSRTSSSIAGSAPAAQVPPSAAALQKDLDESEAMFASIRDEAMQENETRQERDQNELLDAATASRVGRIVALRKQQRQIRAQEQAIAKSMSAGMGANTSAADESESRIAFRASGRMVLVSVVLRDAQGHAIGNLKQDAFQLFDNGKPQVITQFSLEAAKVGAEKESKAAESSQGPGAAQPVTNAQPATAERNTAYLFDDAHASSQELSSASSASERHMRALTAGEHAAVFTTSGAVMVDFTDDRGKLLAAVRALRPHGLVVPNDCPSISYYMADLIINKEDVAATGVAIAEVLACVHGISTIQQAEALAKGKAREVLNAGGLENTNSIAVLRNVVRRTGMLPGQRSIVLVSPGFVAITQEEEDEVTGIINRAVESGTVINALDARGLYTVGLSGTGGPTDSEKLQIETADGQARSDVMAELASSTGGVFFHNNNNLDEGFRRTGDGPEFLYVLGFSPQKLDGKFHRLKVTLNAAGKFEVQARRGYYAARPAAGKSVSTAQ
jgi:VWFA-related protein